MPSANRGHLTSGRHLTAELPGETAIHRGGTPDNRTLSGVDAFAATFRAADVAAAGLGLLEQRDPLWDDRLKWTRARREPSRFRDALGRPR
jgi:hypothetical protein